MISLSLASYTQYNSIYDYSIKTVNNKQILLKDYAGKKIVIVIIPAIEDSNGIRFLYKIDSVGAANQSKAVIIGVHSLETDIKNNADSSSSEWNNRNNYGNIIFSEAIYTHKSSKTNQDKLFNWLTNATENNHFDMEVGGVGTIYIINELGELTTVINNNSSNPDEIPLKIFAKF